MATDTDAHVARIEEQGFTIVEDAIESSLVDAIAQELLSLERDLGVLPAKNIFEGNRRLVLVPGTPDS